ncbi:MAG: hypothetical protein WAO71_01550 [Gallionella sp.]
MRAAYPPYVTGQPSCPEYKVTAVQVIPTSKLSGWKTEHAQLNVQQRKPRSMRRNNTQGIIVIVCVK